MKKEKYSVNTIKSMLYNTLEGDKCDIKPSQVKGDQKCQIRDILLNRMMSMTY